MRARDVLRLLPWPVYVLLALAPAGAVLYGVARDVLEELTREDGVIEYGQALAFLAGALFFLAVVARSRGRHLWGWVFGIGLVGVAGEEVSWGQRIFGIDTPEGLASSNVQGELNLHNIDGIHQNIRAVGILLVVVLFIVAPVAWLLSDRLRRLEASLRLPPVPLAAAPLAFVALAYMAIPRALSGEVFALDEVGELYLALTAAAYGWSALRSPVPPAVAEPVVDVRETESEPVAEPRVVV